MHSGRCPVTWVCPMAPLSFHPFNNTNADSSNVFIKLPQKIVSENVSTFRFSMFTYVHPGTYDLHCNQPTEWYCDLWANHTYPEDDFMPATQYSVKRRNLLIPFERMLEHWLQNDLDCLAWWVLLRMHNERGGVRSTTGGVLYMELKTSFDSWILCGVSLN